MHSSEEGHIPLSSTGGGKGNKERYVNGGEKLRRIGEKKEAHKEEERNEK